MLPNFEESLHNYAELAVQVGLNLQPGQRLLIKGDPAVANGVSLHAAPLVRQIAASAYRAGARLVDVIWADEQVQLARFQYAPRDSFEEYPAWQSNLALEHATGGDALLTILADDPDLLSGQDPELNAVYQKTALKHAQPYRAAFGRNASNWLVIAAAAPAWAAKVFPDVAPDAREAKLWDAIFRVCRLDQADPVAAWQEHIRRLGARSQYLNRKQYAALHFTAPGTSLTLGLPQSHVWNAARSTSQGGIPFTANLPTEEIFTLPHKDRVEGIVTASMPFSYGGTLIENMSLTFQGGRVVQATADKGEAAMHSMLETDEGAGRLGEVALVPHHSPIAQSGMLFYNTLLDENAATHLALGRAYKFTVQGGEAMNDDEFAAAGANLSLAHVDFMIGSTAMDVDGLAEAGATEPVMRSGEWAFDV